MLQCSAGCRAQETLWGAQLGDQNGAGGIQAEFRWGGGGGAGRWFLCYRTAKMISGARHRGQLRERFERVEILPTLTHIASQQEIPSAKGTVRAL